jgi:peptidoglycan hydrolase CwlO-like protein
MMKYFCLFMVMALGIGSSSCPVLAQENNIMNATSALQGVLAILKQSVDKLSFDNDQLAAQDNTVKGQVLQLQERLRRLEAQGDDLNKAAEKLRKKDPARQEQIARLEEENAQLDGLIQKDAGNIKLIQRSLAAGARADQSPDYQDAVRRQKERLRLMKMIYESQERQGFLHGAILEAQKKTPLPAAAGALQQQQILQKQINEIETQMAAYSSEGISRGIGSADQWEDAHMRQLGSELKILERNYAQLKNLIAKMSKRIQSTSLTVSQRLEEGKLQNSNDNLNRQNEELKAELNDLRAQMIELDKRKSYLEMMIRQN